MVSLTKYSRKRSFYSYINHSWENKRGNASWYIREYDSVRMSENVPVYKSDSPYLHQHLFPCWLQPSSDVRWYLILILMCLSRDQLVLSIFSCAYTSLEKLLFTVNFWLHSNNRLAHKTPPKLTLIQPLLTSRMIFFSPPLTWMSSSILS